MIKRLRYYFDRITDSKTTTYRYTEMVDGKPVQRELFEGECHVLFSGRGDKFEKRREPTHWLNGIAYTFEQTHKLAQDRPTLKVAIPVDMLDITSPTLAAADYCLRAIKPYFDEINSIYHNRSRPDHENGKFYVYNPTPQVLLRNTSYFAQQPAQDYEIIRKNVILVNPENDQLPSIFCLHIRMEVQLPYGKLDRAKAMLCNQLPEAIERFIHEFDASKFQEALHMERKQKTIRNYLRTSGYCAFIANGAILPRERINDKPALNAVPFQSPKCHEIEIGGIKGMGIRRGVTVITGGGYSGKSTILNAISAGIYNHIKGDGRELCITDETAVTITAEDGRPVSSVNLSPFIKWIPGSTPIDFTTTHASGSTSQSANIMEAVSIGSKLLLIDEDRSATNFMIRDAVMKELIEKEPITPFTDRVSELSEKGVSTILVIGGSGEYISVADSVFMMDEYKISEITTKAKTIAPNNKKVTKHDNWVNDRLITKMFTAYPEKQTREHLTVSDTGFILIGDERIDVRNLHDIATEPQINALAFILRYLAKSEIDFGSMETMALIMRGLLNNNPSATTKIDILEKVNKLYAEISESGLNFVDTGFFPTISRFMDLPRNFEVLAAINRMRSVEWQAT